MRTFIIGGAILYALYMALPVDNENFKTQSNKISSNFSFDEFKKTSTGLPNDIPEKDRAWIVALVNEIMQPLRNKIGAIQITSGYRSPEVNTRIGGSPTSQHMLGQACDFYAINQTRTQTFLTLFNDPSFPIRQCILYAPEEGNFVHVAIDPQRPAKRQFLIKQNGTFYPYTGGSINL